MLERNIREMDVVACSGGEGDARRQLGHQSLGLGEAWPDQEAPGVKSKMESSCEEKREAGDHGHVEPWNHFAGRDPQDHGVQP